MADAAPGDAAAKKAAPRDAAAKKAAPKRAAAKEDAAPEAESAAGGSAADESAADEMKRKFRAALDHKQSQLAEHNARQGGKGGGKVQGAHGPAQSKRAFRRKSGG